MSMHGPFIEIRVIRCTNLKNTKWFAKQSPYVRLEYAGREYRTPISRGGGTNPNFNNEKFAFPFSEGVHEIIVDVWTKETFSNDVFICSGKIPLIHGAAGGGNESSWPLTTRSGRRSGEISVVLVGNNHGQQSAPVLQHQAPVFLASSLSPQQHWLPAQGPQLQRYPFNSYVSPLHVAHDMSLQSPYHFVPEHTYNYPMGHFESYGGPSSPMAAATGAYYPHSDAYLFR